MSSNNPLWVPESSCEFQRVLVHFGELLYVLKSSCALQRTPVHFRQLLCVRKSSCALQRAPVHFRELLCVLKSSCVLQRAPVHFRELLCVPESSCLFQRGSKDLESAWLFSELLLITEIESLVSYKELIILSFLHTSWYLLHYTANITFLESSCSKNWDAINIRRTKLMFCNPLKTPVTRKGKHLFLKDL